MDITMILWDLAVILLSTKALGMLMRKLGLPQVVGAVIAGVLIGPAIWGRFGWAPVNPSAGSGEQAFLTGMAEIGVIMILFSAGLETDVKELRRTGAVSTIIALFGVLVPMGLGILVAIPFLGGFAAVGANSDLLIAAIFIGTILTATSVGITVETLKELGKLSGRVGQTILSAAIIDDVIGIIVLSVVIGFKDPSANAWVTLGMTAAFFAGAIVLGIGLHYLFRWLANKYPNTRRIPIFGLVVCFFYAFAAEKWFGIADITGAYVAGITLSTMRETDYIDRKISINSYMIFSPVFFANIGISHVSFEGFSGKLLLFSLVFVAAGILGKIIGCGTAARVCRSNTKDSLRIGCGMIARGEVALVVCNKGVEGGLFTLGGAADWLNPMVPVILLVIVSSLLCPIFLKLLYRKNKDSDSAGGGGAPASEALPESVGVAPDSAGEVESANCSDCASDSGPVSDGEPVSCAEPSETTASDR